jgi:surface antigen
MKHPIARLGATLLLGASLAGCGTPPPPDGNQQAGTVIGAVAGGLLGSQIGRGSGSVAATVLGAIAGGAIGSRIGQVMDNQDRMRTAYALETVPTGTYSQWRNPDTGYQYQVTPTRTYAAAQGPCREYTMDVVIGGRLEKAYGTACRQPDGSWRTVN